MAGSPKYSIDVLTDQPPTVSFTKPGRDTSASPIEEVFLEAKAEDDYGVKTLDLVYSVNGGAEKTVKLFDGTTRMPNVSAGHTLYLEEMGVKAGRLGRRTTRASATTARSRGSQKAMSDLYFVRVRPLRQGLQEGRVAGRRRWRRRRRQQDQVGALSEQQRQIIAATFNVQRDRARRTARRS